MWITILQFLLSLSILVVLHECGHFFTAKWFKTKVEKFYLFFNPGFSLYKVQMGETEYGIGWLPLGGYVKIAGMIDESFDKEQMAGPPQPWEFRSKPAWQRLIIMLGGVIVNFILGMVIFAGLLWNYGETYITNDSLKYGIYVDSLGQELGMRDGDLLLKVGDAVVERFPSSLIKKEIAINNARTITVRRNNQDLVLNVNDEVASSLVKHENKDFELYSARMPYVINMVSDNTPAAKVGLKSGDRIIAVNGVSTPYIHQSMPLISGAENDQNEITVIRDLDTMSFNLTLSEDRKLGVFAHGRDHFFDLQTIEYSFLSSIPAGIMKSIDFIKLQVKAFGQMFTGKINPKDSLGSFITIGKMFGTSWDWARFWSMTASLSLLLGFLNLLPIPALDGGHVVFLLFEWITGIKPSDTVIEYATLAGFLLLVILMIYAMGIDVVRHFF